MVRTATRHIPRNYKLIDAQGQINTNLPKLGIEPTITSQQEFAAIIAYEVPKWADVVRTTAVRVD